MTMRQLRERYAQYFNGILDKYMDAFNARNSKNSELMQVAEKLSRRWTELRDKNPDMELEFSRIGTESTATRGDHERPPRLTLTDLQQPTRGAGVVRRGSPTAASPS